MSNNKAPEPATAIDSPKHTTRRKYFSHRPNKSVAALSIGALGVVYGDIGTSPLYALNLMFFGHEGVALTPGNIYGGISLVIWALTIVVALKYAIFVLRADNDGEGGVFALYGLLDKFNTGRLAMLSWSLLIGAGLLLGDGMITPAISVLSAVEGIAVATPISSQVIILITLAILTLLFAFQYKGTGGIGKIFGPVIVVWFIVIAVLGVRQIEHHPEILNAFNPVYAINFLRYGDFHHSLFVLGALILVLTGGEAMYADMGHFGARPIRLSWFLLVYPSLLLNYLGQGAFLLGGGARLGGNLFFSMVPENWLYPMVALATMATIIASQALISGAFSLIAQAIALELMPRLKVHHTHQSHVGQVYLPFINWSLFIGCSLLVISFGSSEALGSAYGLAESGVMIITSTSMFFIARRYWNWGVIKSASIFGALALIDCSFLVANTFKFWEGGFIPMLIGLAVFLIMVTWRWGRKATSAGYAANHTMKLDELIRLHRSADTLMERASILMIPLIATHGDKEKTPTLLQMIWKRTGILPRNLIYVQIIHLKVPYIHENRYSVTVLERNKRGSILLVQIQFGFLEDPNVEYALNDMFSHKEINLPLDKHQWVIHVAVENLLPSKKMNLLRRFQLKVFMLLRNISRPAYYQYGLGDKVALSAEIFPINVH